VLPSVTSARTDPLTCFWCWRWWGYAR